ncbi:MAG TPA: PEGA domain-containing protein [Vicinamibacteria bacterium]|nr:PEGA domain-containing protein [Vicinamibacteria bacterium]
MLVIRVKPDAEITVDGVVVGKRSRYTIALAEGTHSVMIVHPKYQPLSRKIDVIPGEKVNLSIDLKDDAVPR